MECSAWNRQIVSSIGYQWVRSLPRQLQCYWEEYERVKRFDYRPVFYLLCLSIPIAKVLFLRKRRRRRARLHSSFMCCVCCKQIESYMADGLFLFCFWRRISALRAFISSLTCSALITSSVFLAAAGRKSSTFYTSRNTSLNDSSNNRLLMDSLLLLCKSHSSDKSKRTSKPLLVEALLTDRLNLRDTFHCLQCSSHQVAVVFHWAIPYLLELKGRILGRQYQQKQSTTRMSLPLALLNAFVHFTLRGLRFRLKLFLHFERQNRKT